MAERAFVNLCRLSQPTLLIFLSVTILFPQSLFEGNKEKGITLFEPAEGVLPERLFPEIRSVPAGGPQISRGSKKQALLPFPI